MYQFHWKPETEASNFYEKMYGTMRWLDGQTDFYGARLLKKFFPFFIFFFFFKFWSDDIYFFFGASCSTVAIDAVADVAAAVELEFVECYCHLPRSSYKNGASLKAPYPLRISQFFV